MAVHQPMATTQLRPGQTVTLDANGLAAAAATGDVRQVEDLIQRLLQSMGYTVVDPTKARAFAEKYLNEARRQNCQAANLRSIYMDMEKDVRNVTTNPSSWVARGTAPGAPPVPTSAQGPPMIQRTMTQLSQEATKKLKSTFEELQKLESKTEEIAQQMSQPQAKITAQQAQAQLAQVESSAASLECHGVDAVQAPSMISGQAASREEKQQLLERITRLFERLENLLPLTKTLKGADQATGLEEPAIAADGTYTPICRFRGGVTDSDFVADSGVELRRAIAAEKASIFDLEDTIYALQTKISNRAGTQASPKQPSFLDDRRDMFALGIPGLKAELCALEAGRRQLRAISDALFADLATAALNQQGLQLLGFEKDHGLKWDKKYKDKWMHVNDNLRTRTRLATRQKMMKELKLSKFGDAATSLSPLPPNTASTILFVDQSAYGKSGAAQAGGQNLLGRYDVLLLRAHADLDWKWSKHKERDRDFWVMHAAALNVGESYQAPDFIEFANPPPAGGLNEDRYVDAMGHIVDNIVQAFGNLKVDKPKGMFSGGSTVGAEHLVIAPFGMGAFLRKLPLLDSKYEDPTQLLTLRRKLTSRFAQSLARSPPSLKIHVCLTAGNEEAKQNTDAFLRAFSTADASLRNRVTIRPDADALQISHELAGSSKGVILLNAANRQLIGNHWFAGQAHRAIDENLHRRSWTMSAFAYILNNYVDPETSIPPRTSATLEENVKRIGGQVLNIGYGPPSPSP